MSYNRIPTLNCDSNPNQDCAVDAAFSILGGKWKMKIYKVLRFDIVMRFSEIKASLSPISDKTLAVQLREMEEDNLLIRIVYPEVPPKVEYKLTKLGISLEPVFLALDKWGKEYIESKGLGKD